MLHPESTARAERLRQDRLLACGEFLAAVTEVRRAVITAWFRRKDQDEQWRLAMTEADRSGAITEGKLIRILLLLDDINLRVMAEDLLKYVDTIVRAASDKADLESREAIFSAKPLEFAATARKLIG